MCVKHSKTKLYDLLYNRNSYLCVYSPHCSVYYDKIRSHSNKSHLFDSLSKWHESMRHTFDHRTEHIQ